MKIKFIIAFLIIFVLCSLKAAEAARLFTITQGPALGTAFDMGSTQSITYTITNTNTAPNTGERIYEMRFRINTGSTFSNTIVAPTGWTRTAFTTTSVTFRANSWANSIITGASLNFTLILVMRSADADVSETLQDARAQYTLDTNFADGITRTGRTTINTPGSWALKSLSMTLVPSAYNVGTGCQFTLTMTITNRSTSNITGVTSVPKPPTRTGVAATTTSNPADINLNAGATGTLVWTYTAGGTPGTLTFTASARDSTSTRTSRTVTTPNITVSTGLSCGLTAAIAVTPSCLFSGGTATFTMTVTNTTGAAVTNVTPSALTRFGTAIIGAFTGPSPASIASLANNTSGTFTWTAPVTGSIDQTYYVTGFATATGPITTAVATSNTEDLEGYTVTVTPLSTNANSRNQEFTWTFNNRGCDNTNQVAIAIPGGWTFSGDGYAVVTNTLLADVDTWGTGPTFTAPNATDRIPVGRDGDFNLLFSSTPAITGSYTFNIAITDATGRTDTLPTTVTVNPFGSDGKNSTETEVWRESY